MKFMYKGVEYDIRFRPKYLPLRFRGIAKEDIALLVNRHHVEKPAKQAIMDKYGEGAKVL